MYCCRSVQATQMPTLKEETFDPDQVNAAPVRSSVARSSAPEQIYNPYLLRDGIVPEGRLGAVIMGNLSARIPRAAPTTTKTITSTVLATTTSFVTTTGTLMISGCSPACLTLSTCRTSG